MHSEDPVIHSERSASRLKPRYPRLQLLFLRRRCERRMQDWICQADEDGLVHVLPMRHRP